MRDSVSLRHDDDQLQQYGQRHSLGGGISLGYVGRTAEEQRTHRTAQVYLQTTAGSLAYMLTLPIALQAPVRMPQEYHGLVEWATKHAGGYYDTRSGALVLMHGELRARPDLRVRLMRYYDAHACTPAGAPGELLVLMPKLGAAHAAKVMQVVGGRDTMGADD